MKAEKARKLTDISAKEYFDNLCLEGLKFCYERIAEAAKEGRPTCTLYIEKITYNLGPLAQKQLFQQMHNKLTDLGYTAVFDGTFRCLEIRW